MFAVIGINKSAKCSRKLNIDEERPNDKEHEAEKCRNGPQQLEGSNYGR